MTWGSAETKQKFDDSHKCVLTESEYLSPSIYPRAVNNSGKELLRGTYCNANSTVVNITIYDSTNELTFNATCNKTMEGKKIDADGNKWLYITCPLEYKSYCKTMP